MTRGEAFGMRVERGMVVMALIFDRVLYLRFQISAGAERATVTGDDDDP